MNILSTYMVRFKTKIIGVILIFAHLALSSQENKLNKKIFGKDVISTEKVEYGCTFSANGDEIYFVRSPDPWGSSDSGSAIYYSAKISGKWSEPKIVAFSGMFNDSDPYLTPDGNRLFFISDRAGSQDIWLVDKKDKINWGDPLRIPHPINSDGREYSPRTDDNGNLYFASDRPTGFGQGDLYVARLINGQFQQPENLGESINKNTGEWNLEISGDGTILIFEASGREENLSPYGDLYISFREEKIWTTPQNLRELNTSGSDLYPLIQNNGAMLYYSSSDSLSGKNTNIYAIPFEEILKEYRKKARNSEE